MKIQKQILLETMKTCMPGVEKGSSLIEGADTFVFANNAIHSYNDGISVSAPLELNGLAGAVKSMDFYKLIDKLPTDEIDIAQEEGAWAIKTKSLKAKITLIDSAIIEYISQLKLDDLSWSELPGNFFEALSLCRIAGNHSLQRGVYIGGSQMVSTDTIRINRHTLEEEMPCVWLDDPAVQELIKIKGIVKYALQPSWIHFTDEDGAVFSCKRSDEETYPIKMIEKHLANNVPAKADPVYNLPPDISKVVDRVSILADTIQTSLAITMVITKKGLIMQSSKTTGSIKERIKFDKPLAGLGEDEKIKMSVDPNFIIEASKKVTGFVIKNIDSQLGPVQNLVFFNDNYIQIVSTFQDKV